MAATKNLLQQKNILAARTKTRFLYLSPTSTKPGFRFLDRAPQQWSKQINKGVTNQADFDVYFIGTADDGKELRVAGTRDRVERELNASGNSRAVRAGKWITSSTYENMINTDRDVIAVIASEREAKAAAKRGKPQLVSLADLYGHWTNYNQAKEDYDVVASQRPIAARRGGAGRLGTEPQTLQQRLDSVRAMNKEGKATGINGQPILYSLDVTKMELVGGKVKGAPRVRRPKEGGISLKLSLPKYPEIVSKDRNNLKTALDELKLDSTGIDNLAWGQTKVQRQASKPTRTRGPGRVVSVKAMRNRTAAIRSAGAKSKSPPRRTEPLVDVKTSAMSPTAARLVAGGATGAASRLFNRIGQTQGVPAPAPAPAPRAASPPRTRPGVPDARAEVDL